MTSEYRCPICNCAGEPSPRYPRYICVECGRRATDQAGRSLKFFNESLSGGFLARFKDTGESYDSHICYVDGRKCWANEAYMGGIVVSVYDESFEN